MYAALKARAATNVSAEEQRWAAIRAERKDGRRARERAGGDGGSGGRGGGASGERETRPTETPRRGLFRRRRRGAVDVRGAAAAEDDTESPNASPNATETGLRRGRDDDTGTGTNAEAEAGWVRRADAASALDTTVPDASEIQSDDEREGGGGDDEDDVEAPTRRRRWATTATPTTPSSSSPSPSSSSMPPRVRVALFRSRTMVPRARGHPRSRRGGRGRRPVPVTRRAAASIRNRAAELVVPVLVASLRRSASCVCLVLLFVVCMYVCMYNTLQDARSLRPPLSARLLRGALISRGIEIDRSPVAGSESLELSDMSLVGSRPPISPVAPFHSPTRIPQSLCVSSVMSPTG